LKIPELLKTKISPMDSPAPGMLLIADPFLKDPQFTRSVILLCEHQQKGSLGFVINKLFNQTVDELIPEVTGYKIPLYHGGPVQMDTVHFIHQHPDLIEGGFEIRKGIYWGGAFERAIDLINTGLIELSKIKFFIGYSGWSEGQLDGELKEHSWIVSEASLKIVFQEEENNIWKQSLLNMGDNFAMMANFPLDPSLN
jgi:putative transcriptional regulator